MYLDGFVLFKGSKQFLEGVKSEEFLQIKEKLYPKIHKFSKTMGDDKFERNCLYAVKFQFVDPKNLDLGKTNLAMIMCFSPDSIKDISKLFEKDFLKKYSDFLAKTPEYGVLQKFKIEHDINFQYFEHKLNLNNLKKHSRNNKIEFPQYFTSLVPEGVVFNTARDDNPNSVKFAFRYDQVIKCAGFHPEKLKRYVNDQLQNLFGKNECCVIYVTDWNIYANTNLVCSTRKENWQCSSEIEIFKASFYSRCLLSNIADLHRSIKRNNGSVKYLEKSDFLVMARSYFVVKEVVHVNPKSLPPKSELYYYITKYKDIAKKLLVKIKNIIRPFCKAPFVQQNPEEQDTFDCKLIIF